MAIGLTSARATAELLANPSFEDPITYEGTEFIGSWEGFSGGAGASAVQATTAPRTGAHNLTLNIDNVNNSFTGVFQDVPNLTPGQEITFSGYHMTPTLPFGPNTEFRIEWRNASAEIARTDNVVPVLTDSYAPFSITATVPAGADRARVVYALQTFSGTTDTGTVYVDDASVVIVPEPALGLVAVAAAPLLARRRK
jgi:MYXO-CTERM domain-containing protein